MPPTPQAKLIIALQACGWTIIGAAGSGIVLRSVTGDRYTVREDGRLQAIRAKPKETACDNAIVNAS